MAVSNTPPPRYSGVQHRGPVCELEVQHRKYSVPMDSVGEDPVELEGISAAPSPRRRSSSKTFAGGSLSSVKRRSVAHDATPGESPRVSPQSATFHQSDGDDDKRASEISSLGPRSRRSTPRLSRIADDEPFRDV